jgi:diguanylate cyclase (GGDEF)-like protein/PAS domain S-box-containing protein
MPEGGCIDILREYADAVRLLERMRDSGGKEAPPQIRQWSLPVDKVSADFFCVVEHPMRGWYILMADASGHGLVSSMFALHVPILFREAALQGLSLPAIQARIGEFLADQQVEDHFVSGILLRVQDREIEVINAGMPDVLLFAADGRLSEAFSSRHLPFGIAGAASHQVDEPQRYRLARGESASLLLYTDGLSELEIIGDNALGRNGILACAQDGVARIYDRLVDQVGRNAAAAHDDISIALVPVPMPREALAPEQKNVAAGREAFAPDLAMDIPAIMRIIENLDYGLIMTDEAQRILYTNPAFTTITGYTLDECIGQTPRMISSGRHGTQFYREMWEALREHGNWFGEIWNRRKDGSLYLEWLDIQSVHDTSGRVTNYLATFTDIMRIREKDDRLRFLAMHDPLTGLANRILLTDRAVQAIRRSDRSERVLAILFIDIDRFKTINDSLGHDIGDEVLVVVAQRLRQALRDDDTLARFGGDQFVCLLPDIAAREDALRVANKLMAALAEPVEVAGHQFKIGISVGISAYPSDGTAFDDLVVRADRAMMRAKQAGGNMTRFFTAEMAAQMGRQLEMEARLDTAIQAGELELFYQPKVDLVGRTIIGVEALVRWRDPQQGMVSPGVFIPVAERSDLIAKIGHWVLHAACSMLVRQAGRLPQGFHVAVNVSPKQFERSELDSEVARVIGATGVEPGRLQLEVTESLIIHDAERVAGTLQRIVDMGVSVALDDFGTGYSNLASLSRLPIDTFKLDQSFVRGIDISAVNASIARSVWHLADGLGKHVVAEGVETRDECLKLMGMGYTIAQGYCFGTPMPEEEVFSFIERWDPETCCGTPR